MKVQKGGQHYSGSQLSDGERAISCVLGQCLSTPKEKGGPRKVLVEKISRLLGKAESGRGLGEARRRVLPEIGLITPARDGE